MRQKEFDILLDIKKPSLATDIEVVQDDINANVFNISLVDGLEPFNLTGTSVDIVFSKSDGTTVMQSSNDSASNVAIVNETQGKIQCVLKTNTIASPGKTIAEVKVSESGMLLTSAKFNFHVRKSLLNSNTVESTNEFPILKKLVDDAQDAIEKMPEVEEKLNEVTNTNSELNQNIQTGTGLKAELDTSIENANTTKIALDGSITEGNNIKDELHDIIANTNYEQVLQGLNNKLDKTGDSSNNIVTFTEAEEDKDIQSGETHSTLFGKILKSIKTLRAALNNKLNKTDLVSTDQVNDPDKATSSAVTYAHGQAIAQLNNNLVDKIGTQKYYKSYYVSTQKQLDDILNDPITTFNATSTILYEMVVYIATDGLTLPTGNNHIIGMHYGDGLYGYQIAIRFSGATKQRICNNGVWTTWVDK